MVKRLIDKDLDVFANWCNVCCTSPNSFDDLLDYQFQRPEKGQLNFVRITTFTCTDDFCQDMLDNSEHYRLASLIRVQNAPIKSVVQHFCNGFDYCGFNLVVHLDPVGLHYFSHSAIVTTPISAKTMEVSLRVFHDDCHPMDSKVRACF